MIDFEDSKVKLLLVFLGPSFSPPPLLFLLLPLLVLVVELVGGGRFIIAVVTPGLNLSL